MIKSKLVKSTYGKIRVIEGHKGYTRLYVLKTNLKTYIVSTNSRMSLDSMIAVNGEYHFGTLKHLHEALNA